MGQLRGGTTIAGWPAIHSGMRHVRLTGDLTVDGKTVLNESLEVNNNIHVRAGGNVTFYDNYRGVYLDNTSGKLAYVRRGTAGVVQVGTSDRVDFIRTDTTTSTISMNVTGGNMNAVNGYQWGGQSLDVRYVRSGVDSFAYGDTVGDTVYPRIMFKNSGASNSSYFRTPTGGMLPYSTGTSFVGTTAWRFKEMHAVDFYEDGTKLSSKYATSGHNHNGVYANSSHSHSNYVTKNGDTMSGALEISGATNDASRITVYSTNTNPRNGGSIELLETGPKYGATNANGFRIRYDGVDNALTVDSSWTTETRHLTIQRNGDMTVNTAATFDSNITGKGNITATGNISNGYATLMSSSIRFGSSDEGYMGTNSGGWVFYGNRSSATYARFHNNGKIEFNGTITGATAEFDEHFNVQKSGSVDSGYWSVLNSTRNVLFKVSYDGSGASIPRGDLDVSGNISGRMSHSSAYGYIHPFSAAAYGADKSYLRYYYAGSGSSTNTSNRNELRINTIGSNAVNTRLVIDNETVPRISYGTGSPPSTSNFRNGDLYIQY